MRRIIGGMAAAALTIMGLVGAAAPASAATFTVLNAGPVGIGTCLVAVTNDSTPAPSDCTSGYAILANGASKAVASVFVGAGYSHHLGNAGVITAGPHWQTVAASTTAYATKDSMPTAADAGFTQTFADDFTTPSSAYITDHPDTWRGYPASYDDTSGNGHYNNTDAITSDGSNLKLHIFYDSARGVYSVAAPEPRINGASGARGQTYGTYTVRWSIPKALTGYKTAWLLWPDSNQSVEGEVDFPEGNLDGADTIHAYAHDVNGTHSHNAFAANSGVVEAGSGWHTTKVKWTPNGVTYYLDGRNLGTAPALGTPTTPMHFILQTETALSGSLPAKTTDGYVNVDWVTVDSLN